MSNFNQGYPQQGFPQGGYPQQGFQQQAPQGQYQANPQGQGNGQGQGQRSNSGFDNHVKMTVIGRLTKDPESKPIGGSKVASSKIAVNHISEKAGTDYWFLEIWGNEGSDSQHNFLVNHCPKGRRVFVEGVPELRQQENVGPDGKKTYSYYPTIKVTRLIGLDGGNDNAQGGNQGANQQQQYNQQQPPTGQYNGGQPQGAPQQQYQQQQPQQPYGAPQAGFPPAPPQHQAPQGGFPPNPPGGGYGAPVGVGAGAPNVGGFPPAPPQG